MRVNLEEGVRRLSLVAGVAGASVGLVWTAMLLNRATSAQGMEILFALLWALLPPVLGFALPWLWVRALGWAVEGFIQ